MPAFIFTVMPILDFFQDRDKSQVQIQRLASINDRLAEFQRDPLHRFPRLHQP